MTQDSRQVLLFTAALVAVLCVLSAGAHAADAARVTVTDPFVELHSGAGRGYPVLEVVEQGGEVDVIERRTTWYRLRTKRGTEGWAPRAQMLRTLVPGGARFSDALDSGDDLLAHRWEVGAWAGDFEGSALMGMYGAWRATPALSAELAAQQAIGRAADSLVIDASVAGHPFAGAAYSPYLTLGAGLVQTRPSSSLVGTRRREDQTLSVGAGIEHRASRNFVVRLEYRQYLLLTSREEHENLDTWKAGLAVYF